MPLPTIKPKSLKESFLFFIFFTGVDSPIVYVSASVLCCFQFHCLGTQTLKFFMNDTDTDSARLTGSVLIDMIYVQR